MALIKCNECGKEISDTSKICVHCGAKTEIAKSNTKKNRIIFIIIVGIILLILSIYYIISTSTTSEYYEYYSTYYDLSKLTESDKGKKIMCGGIITEESDTTFYISSLKSNYDFDTVKKAVHVTYDNSNFDVRILIYDDASVTINGTYDYTDENGIIYITADNIKK